ncbi:MAG: DUF3108 domain-containing protein [Gemmatimonadaceae bacterium]
MTAASFVKLALACTFCVALSASAQVTSKDASVGPANPNAPTTVVQQSADPLPVPFGVGELAQYDVKFGALKVGSASTLVEDIEDVRGISTWHTVFRLQGGTFFFRVNDVFESWIDRNTFSSVRFYQTQQEGSNDREKRYEIFPDRGTYMEMDKKPPRDHEGVKDPLDDGSFLFFVRTLQLEVGHTYESQRYFRPERNPIRVRILRKETIEVPAGRFDCIVLQPAIKTQGIFSENGNAEVWLSDDNRHILVQLKSKLSFGSINLYLRSYKPGA